MSWRIDKQANGRFAIYSSRIDDYIVIDADEAEIERIYAEKGVKVYLASARAQMTTRVTPVLSAGEAKIEASRQRGSAPKEGKVPIGVTGFTMGNDES
jgi:hypothetical protein